MRPFQIEHLAIAPRDNARAKALLAAIGITDWVLDTVRATGQVCGDLGTSRAELDFNYQIRDDSQQVKPMEFELIRYEEGDNWMARLGQVPHFGMHVLDEELPEIRSIFEAQGIPVAQEVYTTSHSNPHLEGRSYHYVIYNTVDILGVALEFIVRCKSTDPIPEGFDART